MNRAVDKWIDDHKEELIEALRANLSIASVKDTEHAGEGAPFGPMIRKALDDALARGKALGFDTVDYDGYCGAIDMAGGKEQLGVYAIWTLCRRARAGRIPPTAAKYTTASFMPAAPWTTRAPRLRRCMP